MKNKGLGRGLRALIPDMPAGAINSDEIVHLAPDRIEPCPFQARRDFDEEALSELAASIKEHGVMQPLVVRQVGDDRFQLIIGERRWRASQLAGLETIPAVIRDVDDQTASEMMLVENLQRSDLNPLEEAEAYRRLTEDFQLTQDEIAQRVGKSRPLISNTLRLLQLPVEVQKLLVQGILSAGHGRALLSLEGAEQQLALAQAIVLKSWSVRQTEKVVKQLLSARKKKGVEQEARGVQSDLELVDLESRLKELLGTKVKIISGRRGGRIEIQYYSQDELARLLEWFNHDLSR